MNLNSHSKDFLTWLYKWRNNLENPSLESLEIHSEKTALVSEDMVVGFCHKGNLASTNVAAIIPHVVKLFERLADYGVSHFLLFQDTHDKNASEFKTYPHHCIKGTAESQTIPELTNLPISNQYKLFHKNSLNSFHGTQFDSWLKNHQSVDTFIVVGDCTDICVYQMAIELKTRADEVNKDRRIIVPADCVATYDLPIKVAEKIGVFPHNSELLNLIFLYHLRLNGVEIVGGIK